MKKPRSVGEKKVEAKKQLPEQTVQNLAKSAGGRTVIPAEQVRTDLSQPLQETQTWGRTDVLRLF